MATGMLLTFIVPTYNRAGLVGRAIDSVLDQRDAFEHPFEIIVVDDGSTDATVAVLNAYRDDPAVVVVRQSENRGLGAARNLAMRRARGAWCALLDSDNALLPGVAGTLEQTLSGLPPGIGVLWADSVDDSGQSIVVHRKSGRVPGHEVLTGQLGGEHFSVIRTSVARDCPYPSLGTTHACEPAFWANVAQRTDFMLLRVPVQFYETTGDRFCAIDNRIRRARELATCYTHTATLVRPVAPGYYWDLRGKAALYRTVSGQWGAGARQAVLLLGGLRHRWRNMLVVGSCLAGPRVSRWALQRWSAR